jgi:hypothetical protein
MRLNEMMDTERDDVKKILDRHSITNVEDLEYDSDVYHELFDYFSNSGEMPYGVMKARTGMPDEWIADRIDDLKILPEHQYQPFPQEDEITLEDTQNFYEELGWLGYPTDELWEAEYQGRKVSLNKPMRGDVKKFKVYVKDPKTGNVKKVNFGHGGTSAKKLGQKTMKIKKNIPARRKSFRARHNCSNPGPKTKARYWSCKAW